MNNLTKEFWEEKYRTENLGWDIGYPAPALVDYCLGYDDRCISILIPGAGNSYEAEYLYKEGFTHIDVLDISEQAIARFQKRVPLFPSEQLICKDFFDQDGQYDLILEQTFFCALHPSMRNQYAQHMHRLLKPGGALAGVLFDDPLYDDRPPFGGTREEYVTYFEDLFRFRHFERCYNSIPPRDGRELFIELIKP
ncbi:MAG: SAM-dependent methyltransferase [Bacteroidetes bacterium SW_11_45_7]|nr:MAG: SAM-dependent methyltransferase [Bacteroidetes bacterium SW_11_45_7]